jgi:hypothetical protein
MHVFHKLSLATLRGSVAVAGLVGACGGVFGITAPAAADSFTSGPTFTFFDMAQGRIANGVSQAGLTAVETNILSIRDSIQVLGGPPLPLFYADEYPGGLDSQILGYTARSVSNDPISKAMPTAAPPVPVKYAVWGEVYGDSEWRTGRFAGVDIGRTTTLVGGLGGVDAVITGLISSSDAVVLGLFGGDVSSHVRNNDGSTTRVEGPSAGIYGAFINGGISVDGTFTVNVLSPHRSELGVAPLDLGLNNYVFALNFNDKIQLATNCWIEPTVGAIYTNTAWDGASRALGFQDGNELRLQGGARIGTAFDWYGIRVEPTLRGSVYSSVVVDGGSVAAVGTPTAPTDARKVFGQGILKLNFITSQNLSLYVEGEVRGTSGVLGAAGRGGLRYTF